MQENTEAKPSQSMSAVFHDLQESVTDEVDAIRGQTGQIKSLLEDAIASLHEAFGSIHTATEQQMKTMSSLMMQVVGADDDKNIFQKAENASDILSTLVDTLLLSSKNNLHALTTMDTVLQRMQQKAGISRQEDAIIAQLLASAEAESIPGETVCKLANQLQVLQKNHAEDTSKTMGMFRETHCLIDEIASKDMEEVFAAKAKVEQIVQHFFQINTIVSESRVTVNQVNTDIRQHIGAAIRALQFEDISRQSLGYTDRHLDRMDGMISILADGLKDLDKTDISIEKYVQGVAAIHLSMLSYRQALQLEESNPVSQENMDEGDVDLF